MHYYQHHINDFISDTANLTDHQIATYLRMVWGYYKDEKPYPDDCESIAFAYRSDEKTVQLILRHYFTLKDGEWHHSRCDKEISQYHAKAETARQSANARWRNANALPSDSDRNAKGSDSDANQEPITNNQEEKKPSPVGGKKSSGQKTFNQWIDSLADDEMAIRDDDPVYAFAESAGIPDEFISLAWSWFADSYSGDRDEKKYSDWRKVFRNSVKGNWAKFWYPRDDGGYGLTSAGETFRRAVAGRAKGSE